MEGLFLEEAYNFADPKHDRGGSDDDEPVDDAKGSDVEEFASDADDENLAQKDDQCDEDESSAVLEVKRRASCLESSGVKHIPELKEDEDSKEHRKFYRSQIGIAHDGISILRYEGEYLCDRLHAI